MNEETLRKINKINVEEKEKLKTKKERECGYDILGQARDYSQ